VLAYAREGYRRRDVDARELAGILGDRGFLRLAGRYWRAGAAEMVRDLSLRLFLRALRRFTPGLVLADRPIAEYCPLFKPPGKEIITTQFDGEAVEKIGLVKMDLLGLQTLTVIHLACALASQRLSRKIVPEEFPLDDPKVYALFARGETHGVFQFESAGMRDLLRQAKPDRLEDLIVLNALYRPGAMGDIPSFTSRKHGREKIQYLHERLRPLLETTYGVICYQEQVIRIAHELAGFTLSEADSLRKAMGKKKRELMAGYGEQFVAGCAKRVPSAIRAIGLSPTSSQARLRRSGRSVRTSSKSRPR
jgi:DNA polymerase-3 subunit alpha